MASEPAIAADVAPAERLRDPALLIVDMQNDFVRPGAPLEVPDAIATIAPIRRLLDAFRARRRPVVFTRFLAREEPDLLWLWSPQCRPDTKCCWKDHRRAYGDTRDLLGCADVIDELAPESDEIIIDKYGYGAFHGTDLDSRLRALGVGSLLVTGTVTQICVEETAREAFHHGYRTTMVSDAVSSFAPDLHDAALTNFGMKFGWVADTETVLSWL
ncbi:cysteine hydrolase family protein [Oceanibacterium hippocampi]|uniref:Peroxyureidoacrylate/ureidoacrylate amidohydrolase RutB n=1 Tax=Oceanibacterium hippocampi TaxID=745714 RepID=A0A1Y5THH9_9PROT|nr:isochorismatase family cysteine hydrolase [Oceanibacterium hippocampi]SLN64180.1 Peroxyureidoacrylate/ureidoacrylate amidohydrolase RutB [Oceanibacterium hippocampi]